MLIACSRAVGSIVACSCVVSVTQSSLKVLS
jgi:hypothetical protein